MIDINFLTGKSTDEFVLFLETKHLVHKKMSQDLEALFNAGKEAGFDFSLTSSFRSFETQKKIWNEKVVGIRKVLDSHSNLIDLSTLTDNQKLFSILRWSAIPGASRHHWGSDFDIYDQSTIGPDYNVQLIPSEYEIGGPFYKANSWLNENIHRFGFFRPYAIDKGGIAPEPWHLSYRSLSESFLKAYTYELFLEHLNGSNFLLLDDAKLMSLEIYKKYIQL